MLVNFIIHISQHISIKLDNMKEIDTTFPTTMSLNIQTITSFSASLSHLFRHAWFKCLDE